MKTAVDIFRFAMFLTEAGTAEAAVTVLSDRREAGRARHLP
jgi:hypothetical protein